MCPDISLFLKVPSSLHLFLFFHNTPAAVLPSCVFLWGGCCFYCMPPTRSCLSGEQKQWDLYVSRSLCGPAPPLTLLLFGCTGVHSCPSEPPPTVLCTTSAHYKLQRLPCAALFIKVWRWSDFGHHCCTRSAHINIHETAIVWLCVWLIQLFKPSTFWEPAKRCLLLSWFTCLSRSQNVADSFWHNGK